MTGGSPRLAGVIRAKPRRRHDAIVGTLLMIVAVLVSAARPGHAEMPARIDVLQHGRLVAPVDGVVVLEAAPFVLRVRPGEGALSLFATTAADPGVEGLRGQRVVAPLGMGTAVPPLALHLNPGAIEHHAGLAPALLERWGGVLGPDVVAAFDGVRGRLGATPRVLMSGRQYASVLRRPDGAQLLPVHAIGAEPLAHSGAGAITLVAFFDAPAPAGAVQSWVELTGPDVVRLRFTVPVGGGEPLHPDRSGRPLDCGNGSLVRALRDPVWQRVERLLRDGLDPNRRLASGASLLACAVGGGEAVSGTVSVLIDAGAEVDARTPDSATPLHWALRAAVPGAERAARLAAMETLIRRGAHVDARDGDGETPLLTAVAMDYPEAAALLLAAGADPLRVDARGESPTARALRLGRRDLAWLIELYASGSP